MGLEDLRNLQADSKLPNPQVGAPRETDPQKLQEMAWATAQRLTEGVVGQGRVRSLHTHDRVAPFLKVASGQVKF